MTTDKDLIEKLKEKSRAMELIESDIRALELSLSDNLLRNFAIRKMGLSITNQYYEVTWRSTGLSITVISSWDDEIASTESFSYDSLIEYIDEKRQMDLAYKAVNEYTDEDQLRALYKVLDERFKS